MELKYPVAKKVDFEFTVAGRTLHDPYAWMENRFDPDTEAFVEAQNRLTQEYFDSLEKHDATALAAKLKAEATSVILNHIVSDADGKLYAVRCDEKMDYSIVMLDGDFNIVSTVLDYDMIQHRAVIDGMSPCPGNSRYCYFSITVHGEPRGSVLVYDLQEKKEIIQIDNTFSATWAEGGKAIYYGYVETAGGVTKASIRRCGMPDCGISDVFTTTDAVMINPSAGAGDDIFITMRDNYSENRLSVFRDGKTTDMTHELKAAFNYVATLEGRYFIKTNLDAPLGKIISVPVDDPDLRRAVTVVPEHEKNMLLECTSMEGMILCKYIEDCNAVLRIFDADGREIASPKLAADILNFSFERSFNDGKSIFLSFESFVDAPSVMRWNKGDAEASVVYRSQPGIDASEIEITQHFVPVRDGEKVPCSMVKLRGTEKNGNNATLMYGYGGYSSAQFPHFVNRTTVMPVRDWVRDGNIYVATNLRGGNEYGLKWHRAGNLGNKKNCFYDYIDIAEWLIAEGYTRREKLAITGQSNGGLLVTACVTMRPDLFGCVVGSVAHTDMIRFRFDPRGPMYTTEYGEPDDEEFFEYMRSYSPYHNIKAVDYPPIYLQIGECDNNVPPYHSKKFMAVLQHTKTNDNPALLRSNADGSHDRGHGDSLYRTCAEMRTFLYTHLGL